MTWRLWCYDDGTNGSRQLGTFEGERVDAMLETIVRTERLAVQYGVNAHGLLPIPVR